MSKKNQLVTQAARDAARTLATIDGPVAAYVDKLNANNHREELPGHFTGVIVRNGRITDVVAANGAVKIEE